MAEYCDEFVLEEALAGEFRVREVVAENGIPAGGTANQFLKKKSSTDFDAEWSDIGAGDVGYSSETTYAAGSVGGAIGDVKASMRNETEHLSDQFDPMEWENGLINNNNGGNTPSSDKYIRTKYNIQFNALKITVNSGYLARVAIYDSRGGATGFLGWLDDVEWTGEKYYQGPAGYYFRIRLRRDPIGTMDKSEGAQNVFVTRYGADQTLSKLGAPADAKITGDEFAKRLNIVEGTTITSGDDLNDYTTPGRYFSLNTAITSTLINCPLTDTGFELEVRKVSTSNVYEQIIRCNSRNANEQFHRIKSNTWSKWFKTADFRDLAAFAVETPDQNEIPSIVTGVKKKTITIATYNVEHYEKYSSKGGIYNRADRISNYRKFLMENEIDMLFLQEVEDTIDDDGEINAFDYLYRYFFLSDHNIDPDPTNRYTSSGRRKILTRLPFASPSTELTSVVVPWTLHENWNGYYSWCICNLSDVGRFLLINVHNYAHNNQEQIENRNTLLGILKTLIDNQTSNYDYFILAGDFNIDTDTDRTNLKTFCSSIQGTLVNGGMMGWFITTTGSDRLTGYCLDNIIVSQHIRIDRIECKSLWANELFSDHVPVVAKLSFLSSS